MLEPFLKWAGGKRWLVHNHQKFLPQRFKRYIEPFLGSGAVFFALLPAKATLADSNEELINAYRAIRKAPLEVHRLMRGFQQLHCPDLYYKTRLSVPSDPVKRAARFIYLNRTCFNGLYRVNRQGVFNVPIGSKELVEFPRGFIQAVRDALWRVALRVSDFERVIDEAGEGDFVYADPPYTVMHNNNNFIKYNSNLFSWDDQVRLATAVKRATKRGALVMISNADHACVRELYRDFGDHHHIERSSILASNSENRRKTTELLVTSYKV